jgi:hypothetical protein
VALLALLASVTVVVALPAGVAHAVPPLTLTATPNPVVIPVGQTTGTYKLDWSTGSTTNGELRLSLNGGPESVFPQTTPSGSISGLGINYGDTHTWRLYTKGGLRPLRSVTVSTRRPDTSCAGTCIKDVQITPHGTFADVKVIATAKLATFEISVFDQGNLVSGMIGWDTTTWNTSVLGLKPNTSYTFELIVRDEAGNKQVKTGAFKTLKRRVTMTYTTVTVNDDSDDLSAGDLSFWFLGSAWDGPTPEQGIDSGTTVTFNKTLVFDNAPDDVTFGIHGWDDDCSGLSLCSEGVAPGSSIPTGSGSWAVNTSEQDTTQVWKTVFVGVTGFGEAYSSSTTLTTSAHRLKFSGHVNYTVSYF